MKKKVMLFAIIFCAGYIGNDIVELSKGTLIKNVNAKSPRSPYFIQNIARQVVEDCSFYGGRVDGDGRVLGIRASC